MRSAIALMLTVTVLTLGAAGPALAVAPSVETIVIDTNFSPPQLSAACGFAVSRHVAGSLRVRTFFDAGGDFQRELDTYNLTETLTANGASLIGRTSQVIVVDSRSDGGYTIAFTGTDFRLPVPGSGISFGIVGRFVLLISADNDVIDVLQDVGDARSDVVAICAALSPGG